MSSEEFARIVAHTSSHTPALGELSADSQLLEVVLSDNTLLTRLEQVAVFMNLAISGITPMPKG